VGLREALCGRSNDCVIEPAFASLPGANAHTRMVAIVTEALAPISSDNPRPECRTQTIWLVRMGAGGAVVDRQLVGAGCAEDTPPGGACDGLGPIAVLPPTTEKQNVVVVSWESAGAGCGGWTRSGVEIDVSLESFRVLRRSEWQGRVAEPDERHSKSWDFASLHFTSEWEVVQGGSCGKRTRGPFLGIPRMALPEKFVDGDWRTTDFDACAAIVDPARGVAFGGAAKSNTTLRLLMSDSNFLFVDVAEDPHVRGSGVLQVCSAEWNAHTYDYCQVHERPRCVRISMDGRLLAGKATVERAAERPRFRIQLPPEIGAISVGYVEPSGRSVGSSDVRLGDLTSLGRVFPIGTTVATCELVESRLLFSRAPRRSDRPLLDPEGLE